MSPIKSVIMLFVCVVSVFSSQLYNKATGTGTWSFVGSEPTCYTGPASLAKGEGDTLYAGGDSGVAIWTGTTWKTISKIRVKKIACFGGKLFVAGSFSAIEGCPARNIAQWNGTSWSSLGAGIGLDSAGAIRSLKIANDGTVYVGGGIDSAGTLRAKNFAVWNGASWDTAGGGQFPGPVVAIACGNDGSLYASANLNIYKRIGEVWSQIPLIVGGVSGWPIGPEIDAMAVGKNGELYVAGFFPALNRIQCLSGLMKWNGNSWKIVGSSVDRATDVQVSPSGKVFAISSDDYNLIDTHQNDLGINYTVFGILDTVVDTCFHAIIDISTVTGGVPMIQCGLAVENDSDFCVDYGQGVFTRNSGKSAVLRSGLDEELAFYYYGKIIAISCYGQKLFAAGWNMFYNGKWLGNLAQWNGSTWTSMGVENVDIRSIKASADGGLIAAGNFDSIAGMPATRDTLDTLPYEHGAKWLNGTWTPIQQWQFPRVIAGLDGSYYRTDSTSYHGGKNILKWKNSGWDTIGTGMIDTLRWGTGSYERSHPNPAIHSISIMPDGSLIAIGRFDTIFNKTCRIKCNNVALWNGSVWSSFNLPDSLSNNNTYQNALEVLAITKNGRIFVASSAWNSSLISPYSPVTFIWQNNNWSLIGFNGTAELLLDTSDNLYGNFVDSYESGGGISLYDGKTRSNCSWPQHGSITNLTLAPNNTIYCIEYDFNGHYYVVNYSRSASPVVYKKKPIVSNRIEASYSSRMLHVKLPGAPLKSPVAVTLYSMSGQIIKRVSINNSREAILVPLPKIAPGLYVVAIDCGTVRYSSKIMITR